MSTGQELSVQMFEVKTDTAFKYGMNVTARTVQLVGEISEETFVYLDTALTILEEESKKGITIKINSIGGSVYDAMAIIGRMRASKCKITTEGFGPVMSAAIMILAAGHKRRMSKYAMAMWHEASYEHGGTVAQMQHIQKQMEREERLSAEMMERFTEAPAKYWLSEGKLGKDLYLTAEECKTLGVIDEIF
jgi:ATP-dependent protease ClpP protease subunit